MTGTDVARFTHKSVPVIFEPPCIYFAPQEIHISTLKTTWMFSHVGVSQVI